MDDDLDDVSLHTSPHALAPARGKGNLLLWTAVPAALTGIFLMAHLVRPFGRPSKVVDKALAALQAGDAAKLRTEEQLGMKARAEREIRSRGEVEHSRVMAIFDKEGVLGDREYRRIRKKVADLGDKEYRKLPKDQQKTIREASRRQFIADKGWAALSDEDRTLLGGQDVLADRNKLRSRAMVVGTSVLSKEFQDAVAGIDLAAPEIAKDKTMSKLAAQAQKAGLAELQGAIESAEMAAMVELQRMSKREREKVDVQSYVQYVLEAGLKATDDKTRAKATLAQLLDDDSKDAWALRRKFGAKDLDAESRAAIEKLDYNTLTESAGRRAFVEEQGTKLWGEKLRETFNADCCKTTTVRYLGESGRSLLRNASATVALEFGPPPPKPHKDKADKPDKADKADKKDAEKTTTADKASDKPAVDEIDDPIHPARRYLGQTVVLEYRWGSWQITSFSSASEDEPSKRSGDDALKAALGALSTLKGGGFAGFVLLAVFGALVLFLIITKRKNGPALSPVELSVFAIALGLAASQIAAQGQATLDDLWFTPFYLAMPIWVGVRRGTESGLVAGCLAGLALLVASSVAGVPSWASSSGDGLLLSEHLLATLLLSAMGLLAGRIAASSRAPSELPIALPFVWLLYVAAIDRGQLASFTVYAHLCFAAAITGIGLLAHQLGLVQRVVGSERSGSPDLVA